MTNCLYVLVFIQVITTNEVGQILYCRIVELSSSVYFTVAPGAKNPHYEINV